MKLLNLKLKNAENCLTADLYPFKHVLYTKMKLNSFLLKKELFQYINKASSAVPVSYNEYVIRSLTSKQYYSYEYVSSYFQQNSRGKWWVAASLGIVILILFVVDNVGSGCPVSPTRGSYEKRSTNKLQMKYYMKYIRIN